jgi:proteic killer suppression protein
MIRSFHDKDTERVWLGEHVPRFGHDLRRQARRRLVRLNSAGTLNDLRAIPGNRLEPLRGDRAGQHSIRVNDQWRICFRWTDVGAVSTSRYHLPGVSRQ